MYKIELPKLNTKWLGKETIYYKEIDSTQKEVWRRIENKNIDNGTLILADIQNDGIGTHGRKWYTSQEENIAFSFVIYPNIQIQKIENLTVEIAETLLEVFQKIYSIQLAIKNPNDIIINNKKVGGILAETKLRGEQIECLVIGIGINTNQQKFTKEIENIATSIKNEFHIKVDNLEVITEFCNLFEQNMIKRMEE